MLDAARNRLRDLNLKKTGFVWINDCDIQILIPPTESLPIGFNYGVLLINIEKSTNNKKENERVRNESNSLENFF